MSMNIHSKTKWRLVRIIRDNMCKGKYEGYRYKFKLIKENLLGHRKWKLYDKYEGKCYIIKYNGSWEIEEISQGE